MQLHPWPLWSQLHDWTADGRPDENAVNNCGPESVAEVVKYVTDVELPGDYIKDAMYGEAYVGYTDFAHLARFLYTRAGIPCAIEQRPDPAQALARIRSFLPSGWPIIGLFFFDVPGQAGGHFCPIIGVEADSITRSNPWTGAAETLTLEQFKAAWQKQDGGLIICRRKRSIQTT